MFRPASESSYTAPETLSPDILQNVKIHIDRTLTGKYLLKQTFFSKFLLVLFQ